MTTPMRERLIDVAAKAMYEEQKGAAHVVDAILAELREPDERILSDLVIWHHQPGNDEPEENVTADPDTDGPVIRAYIDAVREGK